MAGEIRYRGGGLSSLVQVSSDGGGSGGGDGEDGEMQQRDTLSWVMTPFTSILRPRDATVTVMQKVPCGYNIFLAR